MCAGPIVATACAEYIDHEMEIHAHVSGGNMELKKSSEGENSAEVTVTWSYSTAGSSGQGYAGQES